MRTASAIYQNKAFVAGSDHGAESVERDGEASRIVRCLPGREGVVPDFVERNGRPVGLRTLAWCRVRHRSAAIQQTGRKHGVGNVGAAFFPERGRRAPVVLALRHRQAGFELGDSADLLAPRMVVREAHDGAIVPDEGPDDVSVSPSGLCVEDARARRVLKSEFDFVVTKERGDDGIRIGRIRRRIDVYVMHRSIRAAVRRRHHEVVQLLPQRFAYQMTRRQNLHRLTTFARHQMPSKDGTAPSSGGAGDHSCNRRNKLTPSVLSSPTS